MWFFTDGQPRDSSFLRPTFIPEVAGELTLWGLQRDWRSVKTAKNTMSDCNIRDILHVHSVCALRPVYSDTTQLNSTRRRVELCRYKGAFSTNNARVSAHLVAIDESLVVDRHYANWLSVLKMWTIKRSRLTFWTTLYAVKQSFFVIFLVRTHICHNFLCEAKIFINSESCLCTWVDPEDRPFIWMHGISNEGSFYMLQKYQNTNFITTCVLSSSKCTKTRFRGSAPGPAGVAYDAP